MPGDPEVLAPSPLKPRPVNKTDKKGKGLYRRGDGLYTEEQVQTGKGRREASFFSAPGPKQELIDSWNRDAEVKKQKEKQAKRIVSGKVKPKDGIRNMEK